MAIRFDSELVYACIFCSLKKNKIDKKDILKFCNKLSAEVAKLAKNNLEYKYINFELDKEDISNFYENNFGKISEIGDNIYYSEDVKNIDIAELLKYYNNDIIEILDKIIKNED